MQPTIQNSAQGRRDKASLGGSRASHGFRYQDAVTGFFAVQAHFEARPWSLIPEGNEDISLVVGQSRTYELQVKSRGGQARNFTAAQAMGSLADLWTRHIDRLARDDLHVCLVVDRSPLGMSATGLDKTLNSQEELPIERLAGVAASSGFTTLDLLNRSHLLYIPSPTAEGTRLITQHSGLVELAAEIVFRQVLAQIGSMVDARAADGSSRPLMLSEIGRIIEEGQRAVDLESLERPLRGGTCEYVNFETPVRDESFYLGVDVVAGHVAAGLVAGRPDEVDACTGLLQHAGQAIITGPSGVGKTAIAYLTAHATRHACRWLRVRGAGIASDIMHFTQALRATREAPVGLLIDDIGQKHAALWDELAERARGYEGVVLLGTTREEDLALLSEAPESTVLRPRLDEALARTLWEHLKDSDATATPGWLEAFEQCDGLTLEYVHYLTTGSRLPDTIDRQVQARRKEQRDDELQLLRVVSLAASVDASIDVRRFASLNGLPDEEVQRSLSRLAEEHLVRALGPNEVTGLHAIRTAALVRSTHALPPPSLQETANTAIECCSARHLPALLAEFTVRDLAQEPALFHALASRLSASTSPDELSTCLNSLRAVTVRRRASQAKELMDACEVPASHRHTTASLMVIPPRDLSGLGLKESIHSAVTRFHELEVRELRDSWLDCIPDSVVSKCLEPRSATEGIELLRAMGGMSNHIGIASAVARSTPRPVDIDALADFLDAGRLISPDVAEICVQTVGSADEIERLARHQPWISYLSVEDHPSPHGDGVDHVVEFHRMQIEHGPEIDLHDAVVATVHLFFCLFPHADIIVGKAVDSSGELIGYRDFDIADKRIPRSNMPSTEIVRQNRAFVSVFGTAGSESQTDRLASEAELLRRTYEASRYLVSRWIRGGSIPLAMERELGELFKQSQALWRDHTPPSDPKEMETTTVDVGALSNTLGMLLENALPRLFHGPDIALAAFLRDTVYKGLVRTIGQNYWRFLDEDLDSEVCRFVHLLDDLHQVLGLQQLPAGEPPAARIARQKDDPIPPLAQLARRAHDDRLRAEIAEASDDVGALGFTAFAYRLESEKPSSILWPPDEIVIIVRVESLLDWLDRVDAILEAVSGAFADHRRVAIAPMRREEVVPIMALQTLTSSDGVPFPGSDLVARCCDAFGLAALEPTATRSFFQWLALQSSQAGLRLLAQHRPLLSEEAAVENSLETDVSDALTRVQEVVDGDSTRLLRQLLQDFSAATGDDLAAALSLMSRGEADESLAFLSILPALELELELRGPSAAEDIISWMEAPSDAADSIGRPDPALAAAQVVDHEALPQEPTFKAGRNAPCPCGSGQKFKRCHGS